MTRNPIGVVGVPDVSRRETSAGSVREIIPISSVPEKGILQKQNPGKITEEERREHRYDLRREK